ncbi:MAG: hypothetical protein RMX97_02615 [Nostoc sp. DedQUE11]|nr:hypothetical protein [Nostoc sp. DedQUE11]
MPRPKKIFVHLGLKEQENIVEMTIRTSSTELAAKIYESLELALLAMKRHDLEVDWQHDNPDLDQG